MRAALLALCALLLATKSPAQSPDSMLRMDFSNPSLTPAQWTLIVHPDGTGHFHAEGGARTSGDIEALQPTKVDRDVKLSPAYAGRIFQKVRQKGFLSDQCESHLKVAFQGSKKITYSGPDGQSSCEFNYAKDKEVQQLGDSLVSVGSTIIEGARLEMLRQHDPLGLDNALEYVLEASEDGRLQQIGTIRGILEKLQGDPYVMERVRKRAAMLLARADKET